MRLEELVQVLPQKWVEGSPDLEVTGITQDSRQVKPGDLFVCIRGFKDDGHRYAAEAGAAGAVALVGERRLDLFPPLSTVLVPNSREALAWLSQRFYGNPSSRLKVMAVTGTNGKTTVSHLLEAIFASAGHATGLIGTVYNKVGSRWFPSTRTTPESVEVQRLLREMADGGVRYAIMEVSSHALELGRVIGCDFDAAILTNITRDHFDFHGGFRGYLLAKKRLFSALGRGAKTGQYAVINADDPSACTIMQDTGAEIITYGLHEPAPVTARDIRLQTRGSSAAVKVGGREVSLRLNFPGLFNIYNALAAMAVAWREGIDPALSAEALSGVRSIPGRCQDIDCGQEFQVLVDFAHNPDALEKILQCAGNGKVVHRILVFGCEGEKDRTKRPIMGEIAGRLADHCIITSDNWFNEDPHRIVEDILMGLRASGKPRDRYEVILDRYRAIERALGMAERGSVVIVAGRGHDERLVLGNEVLSFKDEEIVREILGRHRGRRQ